MKRTAKRISAIFLSLLMIVSCLPVVAFAGEVGTLTIGTQTNSDGVEIDDDVAFDYEVLINDEPFTGTALGDDGNVYTVNAGQVTIPYSVKVTIENIAAGSSYRVKRLGYDNEKYALVGETEAQFGKVAENTYFKSVNGEETVISAAEYNDETNNGTNTEFKLYKDADDTVYTEDKIGVRGGYNSASDLTDGEYYYVIDSLKQYVVNAIFNRGSVSETSSGSGLKKKITYTATGNYSFSCEGFEDIANNTTGVSSGSSLVASKNAARTNAAGNVTSEFNSYVDDIWAAVLENESGKLVRLEDKGTLAGLSGYVYKNFSWPGEGDNSTETTSVTISAFTEILDSDITEYKYRVEYGEENKTAVFDVTLIPAPTGTFQINFALNDTVPAGFKDAVFTIKDEFGRTLTNKKTDEDVENQEETQPATYDYEL